MSGGFKTRSGKPVGQTLRELRDSVEQAAVTRGLDAAAAVGLNSVRAELNRPGTPDLHAAPGQAPLRQSGQLAASAHIEAPSEHVRRVIVGGTSAPYAPTQELGSRSQAPRPFLRPSLIAARRRMLEALAEALHKKGRD